MYETKIHVIIPVYNCKDYLAEAVDSVLSQPWQKIDVYLIDDGSTDGSGALCDAIAAANSRIRVFHQENCGVSAARNNGIEQALARASDEDYIGFCDSDDRWMPNAVTSALFAQERFDIETFGEYCADQTMDRFYVYSSFADEVRTDIRQLIWKPSHFCASLYACGMIRSFHIRFSSMTKYIEDFMFATHCRYSAKRIRCHKEHLYLYRHNTNSAMHTRSRISKIDYFTQIINGWMETEELINADTCRTGRSTHMGSTLASIYFLDMAAQHYQNWGTRQELERAFASNPHYHLFENMAEKHVSPKQYREHLLLKKHHGLFRLKHQMIGIPVFLMEAAYRIPFLKELYIRRKYRLTEIPENG